MSDVHDRHPFLVRRQPVACRLAHVLCRLRNSFVCLWGGHCQISKGAEPKGSSHVAVQPKRQSAVYRDTCPSSANKNTLHTTPDTSNI